MTAHIHPARRVAIVTTGGDAPGMNACIRSAVLECLKHGITPIGVRRGALGLVRGSGADFFDLQRHHVRGILERGSTMLGSARPEDYVKCTGRSQPTSADIAAIVVANLRNHDIDSLILVGGDTTFAAAKDLSRASNRSLPIVVVPASIDNDLYGTDLTIGYDTALHETAQYIDKIRETARAFERVFIIETMGNRCGLLAAEACLTTGAEELLVPEITYDLASFEALCARVEAADRSVVIVVAEGTALPPLSMSSSALPAARIVQQALEHRLAGKREVRVGNPGYTVRGASPTAFSRLLAAEAGTKAVAAIQQRRREEQSFSIIRFERNASASAENAGQYTRFRADRTLRIKNLVQQIQDQGY